MNRICPPAPAGAPHWPSHIDIPTDWTPEQALAVFEVLDQLHDAVATLDLDQLQTVLQRRQGRGDEAIAPDLGEAAGDELTF